MQPRVFATSSEEEETKPPIEPESDDVSIGANVTMPIGGVAKRRALPITSSPPEAHASQLLAGPPEIANRCFEFLFTCRYVVALSQQYRRLVDDAVWKRVRDILRGEFAVECLVVRRTQEALNIRLHRKLQRLRDPTPLEVWWYTAELYLHIASGDETFDGIQIRKVVEKCFPTQVFGIRYSVLESSVLESLLGDPMLATRQVRPFMFRDAGFVCTRDLGSDDLGRTMREIVCTLAQLTGCDEG